MDKPRQLTGDGLILDTLPRRMIAATVPPCSWKFDPAGDARRRLVDHARA
ncbi:MAG: hypothetical protein H7201_00700 [Candidatus Saccharibacteria bacterium]|nr:hypothetical protein [Microbacteriaceae bacterium]